MSPFNFLPHYALSSSSRWIRQVFRGKSSFLVDSFPSQSVFDSMPFRKGLSLWPSERPGRLWSSQHCPVVESNLCYWQPHLEVICLLVLLSRSGAKCTASCPAMIKRCCCHFSRDDIIPILWDLCLFMSRETSMSFVTPVKVTRICREYWFLRLSSPLYTFVLHCCLFFAVWNANCGFMLGISLNVTI